MSTSLKTTLLIVGALLLGGCSTGFGVSVPLVSGLSLGIGSGGISLGTGIGPVGAGIGVGHGGRVSAGAGVGVGVGTSIGSGASAGVGTGIGTSTVIYDPQAPAEAPPREKADLYGGN
jgi:hypothetical protein